MAVNKNHISVISVLNVLYTGDDPVRVLALDEAITSKNFDNLTKIWEYIKNRKTKLRENLTIEKEKILEEMFEDLNERKIHVLRKGEIEHYLPEGFTTMDGAIKLTQPENFAKWIQGSAGNETFKELEQLVALLLEIDSDRVNTVQEKAIAQLRYSADTTKEKKAVKQEDQ